MSDSNILMVAALALTVSRDPMTILPVEVPAHELPIIQAVFGEDNVVVDGPAASREIDVAAEVERLENKYGPGALGKTYGANHAAEIKKALKEHAVKPAKPAKGE